jgi:superfamily II RNA helicase
MVVKNIYGRKIELFDWQKQTKNYKNLLIIAPTGAGKSVAAYNWAFKPDKKTRRVIFTAPIKSLSNERFLELKKSGKNVGILTGDVRINEDAEILCMTQEIYTNHFASLPNQKVVIDEIHYMFQSLDRARSYAEGLYKTHKESDLLLLSATITKNSIRYFEKIAQRKFNVIEVKERPVKIEYLGEISFEDLVGYQPVIIFVFSFKGIINIAESLASYNEEINNLPTKEQLQEILSLAEKFKIDDDDLIEFVKRSVGIYHGSMKYKEKIFVETLFRRNLIKFMIGTDALSLGVNFPSKAVVFAQLAKYYDGPISKREFLQMAGRAGRLGLWDIGYVGFINTPYEAFGYETEELFYTLIEKPLEPEEVIVTPSYKFIFKKLSFKDLMENPDKVKEVVNEEIETISKLSSKEIFEEEKARMQESIMSEIEDFVERIMDNDIKAEEIYEIFRDIYFDEFDIYSNLVIAERIYYDNYQVDCMYIYNYLSERGNQREQLQFLKFFKGLDRMKKYKVVGLDEFEEMIKSEDEFVLNPEKLTEKI